MLAPKKKKNTLALDACIGQIDVSDVCALIADVPSECVCVAAWFQDCIACVTEVGVCVLKDVRCTSSM